MEKLKKIIKAPRVLLLLFFLVCALVAISPQFGEGGVAIRAVHTNSTASIAGIENPKPSMKPTAREVILSIDNKPVTDEKTYYDLIGKLQVNRSARITTSEKTYTLFVRPKTTTAILAETELINVTRTVVDPETNETRDVIEQVVVNKTIKEEHGPEDLGIEVFAAPSTNLRKGLDLQGGTRVLLEPAYPLSPDNMSFLVESLKERLNVYGLSDIVVTEAADLPTYLGGTGKQFVVVEIAGATKQEVLDLLGKQGKFEARIGNESVFVGGRDITHVARSASQAGIDPSAGCRQNGGEWLCRFRFAITLTPAAAERQADITKNIDVTSEGGQEYLTEQLILFLDAAAVDELNIGSELRGRAVTDIAISGSGTGRTRQEATTNALANMKRLQTILQTGSLPVKLNVVTLETISPTLGKEFVTNALLSGLVAALAISLIVYLKYRRWSITIPIAFTSLSEVILILGFAALINWNLDLAAIAGIIISIGTGFNHQVIITDEILHGGTKEKFVDWKSRVKNGILIIMTAYATTTAAMVPLWFAGAGLLRGFAITTIFGFTFGVFISRPAYAAMAEILLKD
ncbi:hypothetical protein HY639_05285 [Candidatus Woesearchaeota archaeon]|nr:hypothetical protein [Candidatus Woesearchaeota archaeon]